MAQNNCLPGCLRFGPMPVMRSSVIRIVRFRKRRGARGISDRDMGHRQDIRRSQNSAAFLRRYQEAGVGSLVKLIVLEGQGHNYFEDFFHSQELVDFAIARARAGANF